LEVPVGEHRIVASSAFGANWGAGKILLGETRQFQSDTDVGDLDLISAGFSPKADEINIANAEGTISTTVSVVVDGRLAPVSQTSDRAIATVPSAMAPSEQTVVTQARGPEFEYEGHMRQITQAAVGNATDVLDVGIQMLPPPLSFELGAAGIKWQSYAGAVTLYLQAACNSACSAPFTPLVQHVEASVGWLDATDARELTFSSDIPGYNPRWRIDTDGPHSRTVTVSGSSDAISYATDLSDRFP
jgi:hypothetical protein